MKIQKMNMKVKKYLVKNQSSRWYYIAGGNQSHDPADAERYDSRQQAEATAAGIRGYGPWLVVAESTAVDDADHHLDSPK
jgi:hypothetical protein